MTIRTKIDTPVSTGVQVAISFSEALDVVSQFADSDISGDYFSIYQVEILEIAARLIREKIERPNV